MGGGLLVLISAIAAFIIDFVVRRDKKKHLHDALTNNLDSLSKKRLP
jgi:hypothetical protein